MEQVDKEYKQFMFTSCIPVNILCNRFPLGN